MRLLWSSTTLKELQQTQPTKFVGSKSLFQVIRCKWQHILYGSAWQEKLSAKFGFLYVSSGFSNGRREEFLTCWPWPIKIFLLDAYNKKYGCKLTVFTSLSVLTSNISVLLTGPRFPPEQARTAYYTVPPRNHLSKWYCDTQNDTLMAKCVPRTKTHSILLGTMSRHSYIKVYLLFRDNLLPLNTPLCLLLFQ